LSQITFFIGVLNVIITTFVVGRFPEHYWLYHTLKGTICFALLFQRRFAKNEQFYLLDFCWIVNFGIVLASWYLLYDWWTPGSDVSDEWELYFYLIISTTAAGPLGWSVAATGNSMLFHSFDTIMSMFIHSSPMVLGWCWRWHSTEFYAAYPGLLANVHSSGTVSFEEQLQATFMVYVAWWVPYTLWFLVDGITREDRGYRIVATAYLKMINKATGLKGRAAVMIYMLLHAVAVGVSLVVAMYVVQDFWIHTAFCFTMIAASVWQASKRYNYLLIKAFTKKIAAAKDGKKAN